MCWCFGDMFSFSNSGIVYMRNCTFSEYSKLVLVCSRNLSTVIIHFVCLFDFIFKSNILIHRTVLSRLCSALQRTWWRQCTCVSSTSATGHRRNILSTTWTLATSVHSPSWRKMALSVCSVVTGMVPFHTFLLCCFCIVWVEWGTR
jgi:hypothetical protein